MLSLLFRSLNRHTFKSIQSQTYVKRFYSNQDLSRKSGNDDKEYSQKCSQSDESDEYSKLYSEYYRKYYDNFKNKFDNNSSDRQTDNNDSKYSKTNHKNNEKFNSNSYSFSECKYHLLTLKLLEKVGYLGTAIIVGLHFETPLYPSPRRQTIDNNCDQLDKTTNYDKCSTNICGKCKYCAALLSKLSVLSAPIRRNYILPKTNNRFVGSNKSIDISNLNEDLNESNDLNRNTDDSKVNKNLKSKDKSDPIDEICRQLQTASIDYLDGLNNMLGIALIHTEPEEAMKCWSTSKSNPKALFNMGVAFESGRHSASGEVDLRRAYQHYCLSASMGHKQAIYNLSLFYLYGKGDIPVDLIRAEALLTRAAKLGVKAAERYIEALQMKRITQLKEKAVMRSSASAPNLSVLTTCFESYNNENLNKYKQNYSIANRV